MKNSGSTFRVNPPGAVPPPAETAARLKAAIAKKLAQQQAQDNDVPPPQPVGPPLSAADLAMSAEDFLQTYGFPRDGDVMPEPTEREQLSAEEKLRHMGLCDADAAHWAAWVDQHPGAEYPDELQRLLWGDPEDPQYRIR